ncbi:E3 ubiquitin-protein ligase listerin [Papilio xuthus]|uniref:E3 ubiquitin-protein ligase listerin n=1 Tax=Papilio xuthus TaxID=66420 RepID=A0A194QPL6_PAPXU|nr:E3 ubiquitin-protein ligase listerin [Papilio xuthus]
MGGKSKRDRTKNNARPSSSGRSAELLISSTKDSAIFGITTGKPLTPIFPTLAAVNIEHGLNTEYALCFKKFNKKDPITKTKALQELLELMRHSATEEAVAALPAWAHFYPILSVDMDRKVREYTQACQAALAARAGRQLAPQLRRLLPAWLLAACDDYGPARHHAHTALMNTFPEEKLGEAISFCREEIIGVLRDNISSGGEGRLLLKTEEEERKAHGRFIVASSLGALALVGAALPAARSDWLWAALQPLLRARAFWALAHAHDHRLRAAWYGMVGSVWARFGARVDADCSRRAWRALLAPPPAAPTPTVTLPAAPTPTETMPAAPIASAAQAAPAADTPHRWAALLLLVHNAQEWRAWADDKDLALLVKRIHELLQNGGWGDAARLAELLLALLPALPSAARTARFYMDLFDSMLIG